jgi:hypothetical protein
MNDVLIVKLFCLFMMLTSLGSLACALISEDEDENDN